MKKVMTVLTLAFLAGCATTPPESHAAKVSRMFKVQGVSEHYQEMQMQVHDEATLQKQVDQLVEQILKGLNPPEKTKKKIVVAVVHYLQKLQSMQTTDDMVEALAQAYGKQFTDDELDQLIKFYESDLGQKETRMSRAAHAEAIQNISENLSPKIEQANKEYFDELRSIAEECQCSIKHPNAKKTHH